MPSLFTRQIIKNNDLDITFDNNNISFSKIISNSNTYYGAKIINSNYLDLKPINYINNQNIGNYFIPSEWALSFYNSSFNNLLNVDYQNLNANFSLLNSSFVEVQNLNDINSYDTQIIRGQDINPFSLDQYSYNKLIIGNISNLLNDKGTIDLKNEFEVKKLIKTLNEQLQWNDLVFNTQQLETIRKLTGIDTKYNQFFYLIKFNSILNDKTLILKNSIIDKFGENIWNLFDTIINSDFTKYNLFQSNNVLSTGTNISYYYPTIYSVNKNSKISNLDFNFISSKMIVYINTTPYYLNQYNDYSSSDQFINFLKGKNINNLETWNTFISQLSTKYENVENFINELQTKFSNIVSFKLSPNVINFDNFSYILELEPQNFIWFSNIIIVLYILSMLPLLFFLMQINKNNIYIYIGI